jgi:prepilin-type processing-associated H-X9-DG protein
VVKAQAVDNLGQPGSHAYRFAGVRHLGTGNIGFVDGHALSLPGHKVVETKGPNAGFDIIPAKDVIWDPNKK